MYSLGNLDMSIFFKLFDAQVKPMLLYSSEVWGLTRFETVEKIHLFACKKFLSVSGKTPNTLVYGETGRYPLYIDSSVSAVRYWFKLQKLDVSRLPRQAYERNKNEERMSHNWALLIKQCLDSFGFSEVWMYGGVGDEKMFLNLLKQRMIDCYKQVWNEKLQHSDRYAVYRTFKSLLQPEKYLRDITISKFRVAMTKFRVGISDLRINKRYKDMPIPRNCPFCDELDTEIHFLIKCPMYTQLRDKYIYKHYKNSNIPPLPFLLQNDNRLLTRDVAMFIFYAFRSREKLL